MDVRPELRRPQSTEAHFEWRYRCLRKAGFSRASAGRLADDAAFDLHALLELVDRGCLPDLAVRILAPLDWKPRST